MNYSKIEVISDFLGFSEKLKGNRSIIEAKVKGCMEALKANTYPMTPCIVQLSSNKIIDGQHRIMAALRLQNQGIFVELIICYADISDEAALKMLIDINSKQTSWGTEDYINMHCDFENENYLNLCNLRSFIKGYYSVQSVSFCVLFQASKGNRSVKQLKSGELKFTMDDIEFAKKVFYISHLFFGKFKSYPVAAINRLVLQFGVDKLKSMYESSHYLKKARIKSYYEYDDTNIIILHLKKILELDETETFKIIE